MSEEKEKFCPFRLVFKTEDSTINCYLAPPDKMDGAVLVSCLPLAVRRLSDETYELWVECMRKLLIAVSIEIIGSAPDALEEQKGQDATN